MRKIHPQVTVSAAVLMALRSRIEFTKGIENRIGGEFNIPKSVLIFGKNGTGKTEVLITIIKGLGGVLKDDVVFDSHGNVVAKYHHSAGCSTEVGMAQMLQHGSDMIHFIDEFSLNTRGHVNLLKQIAEGKLSRQNYNNPDPVPFRGIIIAATNGIQLPKASQVSDLLATLDRFVVVKARARSLTPEEYWEAVMNYKKRPRADFAIIRKALNNNCFDDLTPKEARIGKELWLEKAREILDGGQWAQYRNITTVLNILTFVKRITEASDVFDHAGANSLARAMIQDLIHFNPTPLFNLTPIQEAVYEVIVQKKTASTQDILTKCSTIQTGRNVFRVLDKLMELGLICKTQHGMYSNRIEFLPSSANEGEGEDVLKYL
jgi:predicted transcriptional regulator